LELGVIEADRFDEEARIEITRDDRRAGVATLACGIGGIEPQATLLFVGAVAGDAAGHQEGADFGREIDLRFGVIGEGQRSRGDHEQADDGHQAE
jgi:hypothetical protein